MLACVRKNLFLIFLIYLFSLYFDNFILNLLFFDELICLGILGIGDWGLGIGDWGLGPIPNPQSPIPNPQNPYQSNYKKNK
jgi:hypothetical protein